MSLIVIGSFWFMDHISQPRGCPPPAFSASTDIRSTDNAPQSLFSDSLPPVDVTSLPFVAQDNTCLSSLQADLSACTGLLSGGEAREYRITLTKDNYTLIIEAEPGDLQFDISLAVFDKQSQCLAGVDMEGEGGIERTELAHLAAGQYKLVVGGYRDNCGLYQLTIREDRPPATEIVSSAVTVGPNGTSVRWTSFAEVGLAHYNLYRITDSERKRVATYRSHGSPADFADYRFFDRSYTANIRYELEAVARDGRTTLRELKVG